MKIKKVPKKKRNPNGRGEVPELESKDGPRVGTSVCPVSRGILQGVVMFCSILKYLPCKLGQGEKLGNFNSF